MQWTPYGSTRRRVQGPPPDVPRGVPARHSSRSGPAATASTCSAPTSRWRSTTRRSTRSSPGPGVLEDISSAYDSPADDGRRLARADPQPRLDRGRRGRAVHRRRPADHRRPAAARVLPPAPAVRAAVAASHARRAACLRQPLGSTSPPRELPALDLRTSTPLERRSPGSPSRSCRPSRGSATPRVQLFLTSALRAVRRAAAHPLDPGQRRLHRVLPELPADGELPRDRRRDPVRARPAARCRCRRSRRSCWHRRPRRDVHARASSSTCRARSHSASPRRSAARPGLPRPRPDRDARPRSSWPRLALPLGRLLTSMPPLRAYAIDIGGSMTGIAAFTAAVRPRRRRRPSGSRSSAILCSACSRWARRHPLVARLRRRCSLGTVVLVDRSSRDPTTTWSSVLPDRRASRGDGLRGSTSTASRTRRCSRSTRRRSPRSTTSSTSGSRTGLRQRPDRRRRDRHGRRRRPRPRRRSTSTRSRSTRRSSRSASRDHPDHPYEDPRVTRYDRRRPGVPAQHRRAVRPRHLRPAGLADARQHDREHPPRVVPVHERGVRVGPRPPAPTTACSSCTTTTASRGWSRRSTAMLDDDVRQRAARPALSGDAGSAAILAAGPAIAALDGGPPPGDTVDAIRP